MLVRRSPHSFAHSTIYSFYLFVSSIRSAHFIVPANISCLVPVGTFSLRSPSDPSWQGAAANLTLQYLAAGVGTCTCDTHCETYINLAATAHHTVPAIMVTDIPFQSVLFTVFQVTHTIAPVVSSLTYLSRSSRSFSYVSSVSCSHSMASSINPPQRYNVSSSPLTFAQWFQVLNHMNIAIFTPALLFSKVAFSLTPGMFAFLSCHSSHITRSQNPPTMDHPYLLYRPYWSICSHCTLARSGIPSKTISSVPPFLSFSLLSYPFVEISPPPHPCS